MTRQTLENEAPDASGRAESGYVVQEAPPGFEPGMEVLQTSALPLGYGAATRFVWLDPSGDRFLQPSQRDGTSNLTTPWRSSKPTSCQATAACLSPACASQSERSRQTERTSHETGQTNGQEEGHVGHSNASPQ
jgi:hypothetical protein